MSSLTELYDRLTDRLRAAGDWVAPLGLRLLLAYEFYSAGMMKAGVDGGAPGWFAGKDFPVPFGLFPAGMNWNMLYVTEIVAGLALMFGLFTRFFAFSLVIVTTIAIVSTHWPDSYDSLAELWKGYVVSGDGFGNFRIPALFLAMLFPLVFMGSGKLSIDHLILKLTQRSDLIHDRKGDFLALALALLVPGIVFVYLIPLWGIILLLGAIGAAVYHKVAA